MTIIWKKDVDRKKLLNEFCEKIELKLIILFKNKWNNKNKNIMKQNLNIFLYENLKKFLSKRISKIENKYKNLSSKKKKFNIRKKNRSRK